MIRFAFLIISITFILGMISCAKHLQPINHNLSTQEKSEAAFREHENLSSANVHNTSKQGLQNSAKPIIITKYPLVNGAPEWIADPNIAGYKFTAVGSSMPDTEGLSIQKKKARMYAYSELAKMVNLSIENELDISSVVVNSEVKKLDIKSTSRQRSSGISDNQETIDEWYDNDTDEYFVIIGVRDNSR